MKAKKWIVGLLSVSSVGAVAPMVTGCSTDRTNQPELSEKTPKEREVGRKATRTYFLLKQNNLNAPESTKVKIVNLYVNGASAKPVAGLIKYKCDSGGNVLVTFNMSIAVQHYGANTVAFDLQLTNKEAETDWTVEGFEVKVSTKGYNVAVNAPCVNWKKELPETLPIDEDLEGEFEIKKGYEFIEDQCDIKVSGTSIKGRDEVIFDPANTGEIYVPKEYIDGDVSVELVAQGITATINYNGVGANITYDTSKTSITHAEEGSEEISFRANPYYQLSSWDVKDGLGISLKDGAYGQHARITGDKSSSKLVIDKCAVFDKTLNVSATATEKEWDVEFNNTEGTHLSLVDTTKKAVYNTPYENKIKADPLGWEINTLKATCVDDESGIESDEFDVSFAKVPDTDDTYAFSIPVEKVKGKIKIKVAEKGRQYTVNTTAVTGFTSTTIPTSVTYPAGINATLTPDAYHTFTPKSGTSTWDVEMQTLTKKVSLKTTGKARFDDDSTLVVDNGEILGNLTITATADNAKWDVSAAKTEHMSEKSEWTWPQCEYTKDFEAKIPVEDPEYKYTIQSAKYYDAAEATPSAKDIPASAITFELDKTTAGSEFLTLKIDKAYVKGKIELTFHEEAEKYTVSTITEGREHVSYSCPTEATHNTDYTCSVTVDDCTQYKIVKDNVKVTKTTGGQDVPFTITQDTTDPSKYNITVLGENVVADMTIDGGQTAVATFDYTGKADTGCTLDPTSDTVTYNVSKTIDYTIAEPLKYTIDKDNTACKVTNIKSKAESTAQLTISDPDTSGKGTITITGSDIKGDLELSVKLKAVKYSASVSATGMSLSGTTPEAEYHEALEIPLSMTSGYVLKESDFTATAPATPNIVVSMGSNTLTYGNQFEVDFTAGSEKITIKQGYLEGKITVTGEVKNYKTKITAATGITPESETIEYTKGQAVSFKATLATGYSTPESTIKCGSTTLEMGTDYEVSVSGTEVTISIIAERASTVVTAPLEISLKAEQTTVAFENPDTEIFVGDTSNKYVAKASVTGTPQATISMDKGSTDATWDNQNQKIIAGDIAGNVTLTATYQGAKQTQTVKISKPLLSIAGETEVSAGSSITLNYGFAKAPTSTITDVTWESSSTAIATVTKGTGTAATVTGVAEGEATITVKVKYGNLTTALEATYDITVTEAEELEITGDTHQINMDSGATTVDLSANKSVTWSVTSGSANLSSTSGTSTTVTPTSTASADTITITAQTSSSNDAETKTFEIMSYYGNSIVFDKKNSWYEAKLGDSPTVTNFVIPGYYIEEDGTKVKINIAQKGFAKSGVTVDSITLSNGTQNIYNYAFDNSASGAAGSIKIKSITFPDGSLTGASYNSLYIRDNAFAGDSTYPGTLESINFTQTSGYLYITTKTFYYQTKVTSITLPSTLTSINISGGSSFAYCTALESINIPASCAVLGVYTFDGCTALKTIDMSDWAADTTALPDKWQSTALSGLPSTTTVNRVIYVNSECTDDQITTWTSLLQGKGLPSTGWTVTRKP